jgi:hypothetical protein
MGTAVLPVAIRRQLDDRCHVPLVEHRFEEAGIFQTPAALPVFPYVHRHPDLLVAPSEAQLFRAQRSGPWVGVISFGIATIVGYLLSPQIAVLLFQAGPSETAGSVRDHADLRLASLDHHDDRTERTDYAELRNPGHESARRAPLCGV